MGLARGAAREALLGVLLARTAAEISPLVRVDSPVGADGTNLEMFVFLVGASGTTKTLANSMLREAWLWEAASYKPGSGEGLAAAYVHVKKMKDEDGNTYSEVVQHSHRCYGWVDEYGSMVAVRQRAGQTLDSELRSAWSGERLGFDYRSAETRLPVEPGTYRLGMAAGIQPAIAGEVFKGAEVGDLQRWLWFSTTDVGLTPERGEFDRLTEAEWRVPEAVRCDPKYTEKYQGKRITLPIPKAVADEVWTAHIARQRGEIHDNDGHRNQMRLRVAGLCALLDGRMKVSTDDWRLAGEILDRSDVNREVIQTYLAEKARAGHRARGFADEERADALTQATVRRVARRAWSIVGKHSDSALHGDRTCTGACLNRSLDARAREYVEPALSYAEEQRWLVVKHTTTVNRVSGVRQKVLRLCLGKVRPTEEDS